MKLICAAFGIAAMCAVGVGAQTSTTKGQTKIEVKDGKKVTVGGCLERNPGGGYMITNSAGGLKYALVTNRDLSKHIGHRVEVRGKATDRGDGKLEIESKVGTSGGGDKTESKTEIKGDMAGMHYLGVDSVKMISSSCM
jgi:hypothetical protein